MNVQCTHCSTVFRVDPRKVPTGGVRVRCSICRGVFEVAGTGGDATAPAAAQPPAAPPAAERAAATPAAAPQPAPAPQPTPAAAATPTPAPAPAPPPAAAPTPSPASQPAAPARPAPATGGARGGGSPFGAADPNAKARRLARALVSDIVTYHPERRDRALADGTLRKEFMDEIKKSWEEYVGQVGPEMAKGTPHFRDALNEILAKGQQVF